MRCFFAIAVIFSLVWSCHDPPPKSDPQMSSAAAANTTEDEETLDRHDGHEKKVLEKKNGG